MGTRSTTERGFGEFVAARRSALLGYADALSGGDRHAAEDLVQETLVKVWQAWPRVADGAPEAYARRVLARAAGRAARRLWKGERPVERLPESAVTADSAALVEDRLGLSAALARLPPRQRRAVVLRHYCDLPESRVADDLNCARGTASSLVSRGLALLRPLVVRTEGDRPA